ncbi:LLM class flavin-dependent oxidoreductase [Melissospora conviva]|uniref:LLM class flavin-dependent oxidoreductase n=1 Tax=Melissospora conviva TaxID=3388432 RepID=UPI003B7F90EA
MTSRMRITYAPWGETLAELAEVSRRAEAAGAETVWVPELHRSATVTAAALAQATSTVRVGTAIALAFTRSPMVTALEALDIDEISGGRFVLGLGSGVQRLNENWHNAQWGKPVGHLRETVRNIREFIATCTSGDEIALEGEYEPMRIRGYERPFPVVRDRIPVYLAAMGPAMTRLAGQIGDGWISHELCSPRYLTERILPELETGIGRTEGKTRADLDVVVSACCSVDPDPAQARRRVAGLVGFYASVRTYADFFEFHGLGEQQQAVIDAFRAGRGADYLADSVTDEMVEALTLVGDRDQVAAQIAAYEGKADSVKLSPPTHGIEAAETRKAQDEIIALIAELTGGKA